MVQEDGKDIKKPLIYNHFDISCDALANLTKQDNGQKVKERQNTSETTDVIISSQMIIEQFGGAKSIAQRLGSNLETGISATPDDIKKREQQFGTNKFKAPKIRTLYELIMENFDDKINLILLAAAGVSIAIGVIKEGFPEGLTEGLSICLALLIIITVNSANNYASEQKLAEMLLKTGYSEIQVYRGSTEKILIGNDDLLVGDLVAFEKGMNVPADMIMVDGMDVECSEVDLTGEPDGVVKIALDEDNYKDGNMATMLAKSQISDGQGKALVTAVGTYTVAGIISEKTGDDSEVNKQTPLQQKLEVIADKIGNVGIACAMGTFFFMLLRIEAEALGYLPCGCGNLLVCQEDSKCIPMTLDWNFTTNRFYTTILDTIIIAISVVVCAIPEGLPLAVTIALSYSSEQMEALNNLVRKLTSSETMGSATHICSDKTGTLTKNEMTVMAVMALGDASATEEAENDLAKEFNAKADAVTPEGMKESLMDLIFSSIMWNSTAFIEHLTDPEKIKENRGQEYATRGNVTEQGIIKFLAKIYDFQACIQRRNDLSDDDTVAIIPFSSKRKKASIAVLNRHTNMVRVYSKGAPDMLLLTTDNIITQDGSVASLDNDHVQAPDNLGGGEITNRELLEKTIKYFADKALRTILVAYRDMHIDEFNSLKESNNNFEKAEHREVLEENLTAIGIFGIMDPLRDGIQESIAKCQKAGIRVIMCTGDNLDTAKAISKKAGIIQPGDEQLKNYALIGQDFRDIVGKKLIKIEDPKNKSKQIDSVADVQAFRNEIFPNLRVLARSSPEDKLILVTGVQQMKGVVAVTGDGTNDAPALTQADVGFSMGITGTDIAKGASDIILLDDNFSSIIVALKYGRNVYDNVRKFLQFQLSVNFVAMAIVFFGSGILSSSPLNAVQMLWVNLVMDTLGALALATEKPAEEILDRQPYQRSDPIVNEVMWRNIFGHAIFQTIILAVMIFAIPGNGMAQAYWYRCIKYTQPTATEKAKGIKPACIWNPYYTKELWATEKGTIQYWTDQKVPASKFDQDLLLRFTCDVIEWDAQTKATSATNPKTNRKINDIACKKLSKTKGFKLKTPWYPATVTTVKNKKVTQKGSDKSYLKDFPSQKMLHYTLIFQAFVFLQIFNLINARKISLGDFNVFSGIFENCMFGAVLVTTTLIQIGLVEIGGKFAKTYKLDMKQNLICIGIGSITLIWGYLLKYTPIDWWQFKFVDLDCNEEELEKHQEVDEDGEPKNPLRSAMFKQSMAKSSTRKNKEMEIVTKIEDDLKRRMSNKFKNKGIN